MSEIYSAVQFRAERTERHDAADPDWHPPSLDEYPLWIVAVDPGETTGLCILAVPYASVFADDPRKILYREAIELRGSLRRQVREAAWYARQVNDLVNRTPSLIVCEDFDLGGNRLQGSASESNVAIPIRWGAALQYAVECGHADISKLVFQPRTMAFQTATDARLKKWCMWDVGSDHKRDATRHAIVALRRVSSGAINPEEVWE